MRSTATFLLIGLFAAGCDDGVSPPDPCRPSMDQARAAFGTADEIRSEENGGDFFVTWVYDAEGGEEGRLIIFRWGANLEGCAIDPVDLFS